LVKPAEGVWSVVTVVPSGYREFCYNVDGEFTVSRKHPTSNDGSCNWRTVYGAPAGSRGDGAAAAKMHWFVELAVNVSDSMQRILPMRLGAEPGRRRHRGEGADGADGGAGGADVEVAYGNWPVGGAAVRKRSALWLDRPIRIAMAGVVLYAGMTLLYIAWRVFAKP
jgi:hypothetical protein